MFTYIYTKPIKGVAVDQLAEMLSSSQTVWVQLPRQTVSVTSPVKTGSNEMNSIRWSPFFL